VNEKKTARKRRALLRKAPDVLSVTSGCAPRQARERAQGRASLAWSCRIRRVFESCSEEGDKLGTIPQPEPTATALQATVPVPIQVASGYQGRDMSWTEVRCTSSQLPSTQSQSSGPNPSSRASPSTTNCSTPPGCGCATGTPWCGPGPRPPELPASRLRQNARANRSEIRLLERTASPSRISAYNLLRNRKRCDYLWCDFTGRGTPSGASANITVATSRGPLVLNRTPLEFGMIVVLDLSICAFLELLLLVLVIARQV